MPTNEFKELLSALGNPHHPKRADYNVHVRGMIKEMDANQQRQLFLKLLEAREPDRLGLHFFEYLLIDGEHKIPKFVVKGSPWKLHYAAPKLLSESQLSPKEHAMMVMLFRSLWDGRQDMAQLELALKSSNPDIQGLGLIYAHVIAEGKDEAKELQRSAIRTILNSKTSPTKFLYIRLLYSNFLLVFPKMRYDLMISTVDGAWSLYWSKNEWEQTLRNEVVGNREVMQAAVKYLLERDRSAENPHRIGAIRLAHLFLMADDKELVDLLQKETEFKAQAKAAISKMVVRSHAMELYLKSSQEECYPELFIY